MDGAGAGEFKVALDDAERQGFSRPEHDGLTHELCIEPGAANIELERTRVVWRLDRAKAIEIIDYLTGLSNRGRAAHQYVDIFTPAETLVLSRDEYVDVVYPWISPT